jgi:hypothetical protein
MPDWRRSLASRSSVVPFPRGRTRRLMAARFSFEKTSIPPRMMIFALTV